MNKEDIIYEFKNIVEESRTEDRQDYYIKLRNALELIQELEEENKQLRMDNINSLCEECSELTKEAGITEEDTKKILKDYRDKVENSIPISVIQNKIRPVIDKLEKNDFSGYADELRDILDEIIGEE